MSVVSDPEAVVFRPPLWSQMGSYSAADDRRLIQATFNDGVIDVDDLRVSPRAEGPNMSVDIAPGHVVIPGRDQADQGRYLCPLAQRVNLPVPAGPAAGQHRRDWIIASVDEGDGVTVEPTWTLGVYRGTPGITLTEPPWTAADPWPASASVLAFITPIGANTSRITGEEIVDARVRTRPASVGHFRTYYVRLPGEIRPGGEFERWGGIIWVYSPAYDVPLDIELRLESTMASASSQRAQGEFRLCFAYGHTFAGATHISPHTWLNASDATDNRLFSRTYLIRDFTPRDGGTIWAWAEVRTTPGYATARFTWGELYMRITPAGGLMEWR